MENNLHLHVEIENLKQRLLEREHHIVSMETNFLNEAEKFPNGEFSALNEELLTWQEKYSRLYESHKRVQKVNQSLEDKLLRIVDKFETEKNSLTRDLGNVTQRLVDARSKIKQLEDENERYKNDVNLAIQLLQCKPTNFVSQKLDSLSPELQHQVRSYVNSKRPDGNTVVTPKPEPKIIKVPIPTFPPTAMVYSLNKASTFDREDNAGSYKQPVDIVSAAIMAKILEERARERLLMKHCDTCTCSSQLHRGTDCSTQTVSNHDDAQDYTQNAGNGSNRGHQGLVRYVDLVAGRNNCDYLGNNKIVGKNSEMLNGRIRESPKFSNVSSLKNIRHVGNNPLLSGATTTRNIESMKLNDPSLVIAIDNNYQSPDQYTRNSKGYSLSSDSTRGDVDNVSIKSNESVKSSRKMSDLVYSSRLTQDNISVLVQDESLWSSLSSTSESPVSNEVSIDMETSPSELPSGLSMKGRDILFGKVDENKRLKSYLDNKSETSKARNREGRTFLSDESNHSTTSLLSSSKSMPKMYDTSDAGKSAERRLGIIPRKTRTPSETAPGPRACSLRMQAGSSNILLANATCYTPVLYTSRPDVLVHSLRSRSTSASSTDTGRNSSPET